MPDRKVPSTAKALPQGLVIRAGVYTLRTTHRGKCYQRSTGLRVKDDGTLRRAKGQLIDFMHRVRNGLSLDGDAAQVTLGPLLARWEDTQTTTGYASNRRAVALLTEHFGAGADPSSAITSGSVKAYIDARLATLTHLGTPPRWQTLKREVAVLAAALDFGCKERWFTRVEFNVPKIKRADKGPTAGKMHPPAKLAHFLSRADSDVRAFLTFIRHTGARHTEALRLRPRQIILTPNDPNPAKTTLYETKTEVARTIVLNAQAYAAVQHGLTYGKDRVFPWPAISQRINHLNKRLGYARGEYVTARDLRHLMATEMYLRVGKIAPVSVQLGHARIATTEIYLHLEHGEVSEQTAAYMADLAAAHI